MTAYTPPLRDLGFALFEVLGFEAHWREEASSSDLDADTTEMLLAEYAKLCAEVIAPLNRSGDESGCRWQAGAVTTPEGFAEAYRLYAGGGWFSLAAATEFGGQGLPPSLAKLATEFLCSANMGFALYTSAIPGAIATLARYGSQQQRQVYERRLISGEWNATMCLTEPHCGTDLGLLKTRAERLDGGAYRITGSKIFITGGEHDLTDNIIHLVLARLCDAPEGTRGISLFIVPRQLPDEQGEAGDGNAVSCGSIEKKMGVRASATCTMNFDGAVGYMLGEENRGLQAMFTFINASRLGAAVQGVAHAELGFQKSLAYARERLQMRSLSGGKNPNVPADPIIVHPDVRRMLLTQKAFAEGGRLLNAYIARDLDTAAGGDADKARAAQARLDLLTPIAKAFLTEVGVESANLAIQVFGGHGYIREWGVEQNLRDARIATLYEGTTGVQALDLLGRKVLGAHQPVLEQLCEEIDAFCSEHAARLPLLAELAARTQRWRELTTHIACSAAEDPDVVGAASVPFLMYSGYLLVGYLWARAALVAGDKLVTTQDGDFYQAKTKTAAFYFAHILPRTQSLALEIEAGAIHLMSIDDHLFSC